MPTENEQSCADPVAEQAGDVVAENQGLAPLVGSLEKEVAGLRADFAAKIRYDAVKERQIASMHEELQGFRAGLHLRLLQPVFIDLIALHDELADAANADNALAGLDEFRKSVLETLYRNGVSSYSVESDEVDTARQRVIEAVATDDKTLDRHVQRRARVGFEYDNGKVLRPEWVVAYRHTPVAGGE